MLSALDRRGACRWLALFAASLATTARAQDDPSAFFEAKVRPVLAEHCYPCHSAATASPKGGFRLDTRALLLRGGASRQPALVPGNAEASQLIHAIRYADPKLQMPPKGRLPEAEIDALTAWINAGAHDPREDAAPAPPPAKPHWAFTPPQAVAPPPVKDTAWSQTPIDQFILAKLETAGLQPAPQTDRRTLIRRATYDLTGLPPTPEAVERFVSDRAPDAFVRLVDELLASPQYGERWARHWLDVARYADTKGYVYPEREEAKFFHSYVYRDWVVRALNDDMPYDQFLRYQIAGDQLPGRDGADERAAMGFLTLGRRFLGVVHDIIDDRIDVVMRGTQGLTMGCARCHDHKFDPLSQRDYYALYGVFAGSSERIVPVAGTAEVPELQAAFETEWQARQDALRAEFTHRKEILAARLRTQVARYLDAALHAQTFPTDEFYEIRGPDDLNPTIVWQWRRYLDRKDASDPVWGVWRRAEAPGADVSSIARAADPTNDNPRIVGALNANPVTNMQDVARAYGEVLERTDQEWRDLLEQVERNDDADPLGFDDPALETLRAVLYAADSPVEAPKGPMVDVEWYFDEPARLVLTKISKSIETLLLNHAGAPPHALVLEDKTQQRNPCVFKRGNSANKGAEVPRRFPEILGGRDDAPFARGSGRAELAEAIASRENPLTSRVIVNRVWQWHFGEGLVRTPSDFGTRCEGPSHPELLDWLAVWFMDQGWSLKELNRLILCSAVWQMSSSAPEDTKADPENRLLAHFPLQRLDFESMRDSLLAVSGALSSEVGGKAVDLFKAPFPARRTLYGNIDRTFLQGAYRVFDFPNPDMHGPNRAETTVPQQALFFMNSPFLMEQSRALAHAVADAPAGPQRVEAMYQRAFQADAAAEDTARALAFIDQVPEPAQHETPEPTPWEYGVGEYDATADRVKDFAPLPHFAAGAYQGSATYPDAGLGWAQLTATGGHPGNDLKHAVVRRWVAPAAGDYAASGTLAHEHTEGEGVRARVVSSRLGKLGEWTVHDSHTEANTETFHVEPGDTIDFVVEIADSLNTNMFLWAPLLSPVAGAGASEAPRRYDAAKDFRAPEGAEPQPLGPWEQYAQVLLLSNRFAFVE